MWFEEKENVCPYISS